MLLSSQWLGIVQATQTWLAVLHCGVVPPHSPVTLPVQSTQLLVAGLAGTTRQLPFVPVQPLAVVHGTQRPLVSHAGVDPPQSVASVPIAQARHWCVVVLQTGVIPPQSVLLRHATQRPLVLSQNGRKVSVLSAQNAAPALVQLLQLPSVAQNGLVASPQAGPLVSLVHSTQRPLLHVARTPAPAAPPHCEFALHAWH